MQEHNQAFTLVEILFVIAIIGILATVSLIMLGSAREKAQIAAAHTISGQIARNLTRHLAGEWTFDYGTYRDSSGNDNNIDNFYCDCVIDDLRIYSGAFKL